MPKAGIRAVKSSGVVVACPSCVSMIPLSNSNTKKGSRAYRRNAWNRNGLKRVRMGLVWKGEADALAVVSCSAKLELVQPHTQRIAHQRLEFVRLVIQFG
jgi:hypothetical protein